MAGESAPARAHREPGGGPVPPRSDWSPWCVRPAGRRAGSDTAPFLGKATRPATAYRSARQDARLEPIAWVVPGAAALPLLGRKSAFELKFRSVGDDDCGLTSPGRYDRDPRMEPGAKFEGHGEPRDRRRR